MWQSCNEYRISICQLSNQAVLNFQENRVRRNNIWDKVPGFGKVLTLSRPIDDFDQQQDRGSLFFAKFSPKAPV